MFYVQELNGEEEEEEVEVEEGPAALMMPPQHAAVQQSSPISSRQGSRKCSRAIHINYINESLSQ